MIIEIETLTPIHIGNGNEISPMEYWVGEVFVRVDLDGLLRDEDFLPYMDTFVKGAGEVRYIGQYVPASLLIKHPAYWLPFSAEARKHLATNPILVKEFIKSAGRAFIPGSSIKGAIFSALFYHSLSELYQQESYKNMIQEAIKRSNDLNAYNDLLDLVFNSFRKATTPGQRNRFFSWIDVSDTSLGTPDQRLCIYLTTIAGAKSHQTLPIVCESMDANLRLQLEIKEKPGFRWTIKELLKMTDHFYRMVWRKCNLPDPLPEGGYLMRLGQGSSAYATSLLLFAETVGIDSNSYKIKAPKTQKMIEGDGTMGWILLHIAEEDGARQNGKAITELHQQPLPLNKNLISSIEGSSGPIAQIPQQIPASKSPGETKKTLSVVWENANLIWNPGNQTLIATSGNKKASVKGKELVPECFHKKLFEKKKPVIAKVEVEQMGNAFLIVKIEPSDKV